MKKFYLFLTLMVVGFSTQAAPAAGVNFDNRSHGEAFIFVEKGVEFAVFPDGQFDFFYNPHGNFNRVPSHINYSFNSGYNYGPFVQYDDYGAVIQIEGVPVYYDYYGRIIQAGRVELRYNAFGQLSRVGNMFLHYDPYSRLSHTSGHINRWNTSYVYRPWHDHYVRPYSHSVVVFHEPYRLHYHPNRMDYVVYKQYYHKNYYNNDSFRKSYYRPGERVTSYHRGRRTEEQKQIRKQNAAPGQAVVYDAPNRSQTRDLRRSAPTTKSVDSSTRRSRVDSPAVQQRALPQREVQRSTARESRALNVPQSSSSREVQSQSRRTERAATVNTATEQNPAPSSRTRSSRGRNN